MQRYLQNNTGVCLILNFQCILHVFKIWASKFLPNLKNTETSLEFLEAQFQNVRISLKKSTPLLAHSLYSSPSMKLKLFHLDYGTPCTKFSNLNLDSFNLNYIRAYIFPRNKIPKGGSNWQVNLKKRVWLPGYVLIILHYYISWLTIVRNQPRSKFILTDLLISPGCCLHIKNFQIKYLRHTLCPSQFNKTLLNW